MNPIELEAEEGERLDRFLAGRLPDLSRAQAQRLIAAERVRVNGRPRDAATRLRAGDRVAVELPPPTTLRPEPMALHVLHEDADLIVLDKPAGLVAHPGAGHPTGTLAAALLARWPELAGVGDPERPGLVHRLDKDTSGVLIVARNERARAHLLRQFAERTVEKVYLALVHGHVAPADGLIDAPIGRRPNDPRAMAVRREGRAARTRFHVLAYLGPYTLLEVTIETGRTHQIRVHLAAIGHPVAGDPTYGRPATILKRQFLHAARLRLDHPSTGERVTFTAPLPPDLEGALGRLRAGGEL